MTANSSPPRRASESLSRVRSRSTSAISTISWSPAGWPRVSLTCLKWSRSSITSAPVVRSRRARASASRRSSSKRRRFFSPVSGSSLASRFSSCIRSLRLQTKISAPSTAERARPTTPSSSGRTMPGRLGSRTTSTQVRSATWKRARAGSSSWPCGAEDDVAVDDELHFVRGRDGGDRRRREVVDPEGGGGEADQGAAALGDGAGRGAVAVDGLEDVDADPAEHERDDRRRDRLAGIAGAGQVGSPERRRCARSKPRMSSV